MVSIRAILTGFFTGEYGQRSERELPYETWGTWLEGPGRRRGFGLKSSLATFGATSSTHTQAPGRAGGHIVVETCSSDIRYPDNPFTRES